jgi:hypothetical protein
MQKYQPITRAASRGPESTTLVGEEREQLGLAGFSLEAGEAGLAWSAAMDCPSISKGS